MHLCGKGPHRADPHLLQPVVFGGEVGIDLGVARNAAAVLAQHVVGEKVLRIARGTAAHRQKEEGGPFGDGRGDRVRHHLDLGGEGAGLLQRLALVPDPPGAVERLADRPEAAGPGPFRRDQADMAADRDRVIGQRPHRRQRAGTVDRVRAVLDQRKGPAQKIAGAADLVEVVAGKDEGVGRHLAEAAVHDHRGRDREKLHPRRLGRRRLVQRLDPEHGVAMLAAVRPKARDGVAP